MTAPTTTDPAHIHRLANTAQVAGFGPTVMPDWLDEVAEALYVAARDLQVRAAQARRASTATADELIGVGQ